MTTASYSDDDGMADVRAWNRLIAVLEAAREMVQHPASREVLERLEDAVDAVDVEYRGADLESAMIDGLIDPPAVPR